MLAIGVSREEPSPLVKREMVLRLLTLLLTTALLFILTGTASAQGGQIIVEVCLDQNADGICATHEAPLLGAEACLNDESTCSAVPATFADLPAGDYTPFLRFSGATQGYYPTTPRTPINLAEGESITVKLGAVYPVHPKGVAVHETLNKVYVAFQGPVVDGIKPYPFVAVIDGETDEVLRTIPGGENGSAPGAANGMGIGRGPWGVAISGNGEFVYVGSFGDGIIAVIDPETDTVLTNVSPGAPFQPTAPAVNPITGRVQFPDRAGGRVVVLNDDPLTFWVSPILNIFGVNNSSSSSAPFEMAIAKSLQGYNYLSMRSAASPGPFKFLGFNTATVSKTYYDILFDTSTGQQTGMPHAVGVWQDEGFDDSRLFITYADDPRSTPDVFPNPNKLLVYDFSALEPDDVTLHHAGTGVGDYAEVGLVYNPAGYHMLGTYAGFAYIDDEGDEAACAPSGRGGTYALDFAGSVLTGAAPGMWRFPERVVGNPPYVAPDLQWRNPFEIAVNPNNNKVYITDRCWNDFPTGGQVGGGAVLIFTDTSTGPRPTPTPTPTVTGTPPTTTPTVTGTPPTPTPTVTGTPATSTPTVTGTPPTATPSVTGTPPTPTPTPSVSPTPEGPITLAFAGPATVTSGDTFDVAVQALDVTGMGLYGAQLEVNYNPDLISVNDLQINPDLIFVVLNTIDNTAGKITFLASRQGQVPGLLDDVTLFTFEATAVGLSGEAAFTFSNERIGDPIARPFDVITQDYTVMIEPITTPEPTVSGTPTTGTPGITETPSTGTPGVTETPSTGTPGVTGTPSTGTPGVTGTPSTGTPSTGTPSTGTPDITGTPSTGTPTPSTGTPGVTGTPSTGTPGVTGTPSTGTPDITGTPSTGTPTPSTGTPGVTGTPSTGTPGVTGTPSTGTPDVTGTPSTGTPGVTGTPSTGTPSVTGTPATGTPPVTGTPPTVTPGVTVIVTITGTPGTAEPTATGTPPTSTPTMTGTPPTATPTVTGTPPSVTPGVTVVVTVTGTPSAGTPTPVGTATPSGPRVIVIIGQVSLPGRELNNWSGATVAIEAQSVEPMSVTTNDTGDFALTAEIPPGDATIKADAPGYLPAICNIPLLQPEARLANTALLSGDINDDTWVDITDAVAIGLEFGSTATAASADINKSGNVDVLDVILVGLNFGEGTQVWPCLSE